jgi:hypothetical protein
MHSKLPIIAAGLVLFGVAAGTVIKGGGSKEATIPAGTRIVAALEHTVSTQGSPVGQSVELRTTEPLSLARGVTIPEGIVLHGEVTHAKGGGRIAGSPELTMRFDRLEIDGKRYDIEADPFRVRGKSDLAESVAEIGGGTVLGAVVGGLKGAVVGAVLGTGVAVATKGDQIVLSEGQRLRIRLTDSVVVKYRPREEKPAS